MSKIHSSKQYSEKVYKKMLAERGIKETTKGLWSIRIKERR